MRMHTFFVWMGLGMATVTIGSHIAVAGVCDRIQDPYRAQHCMAKEKGDKILADYWRSLSPRQRELASRTNEVWFAYKDRTGHYMPFTPANFDWLCGQVGVTSESDRQFVYQFVQGKKEGNEQFDELNATICRASKADGFRLAGCP